MKSAVLLCRTMSREAASTGQRMRAAHIAPYGRDVGNGGEPKEAFGEGFPADTQFKGKPMAICPKCGKAKIRKPQDGVRKCRRCGILPTSHGLMRNGAPKADAEAA